MPLTLPLVTPRPEPCLSSGGGPRGWSPFLSCSMDLPGAIPHWLQETSCASPRLSLAPFLEGEDSGADASLARNRFPQPPARQPHTGQNSEARGQTLVEFLLQTTDCLSFTSVIRDHRHDDQAARVFFTDEASEVGLEGRKLYNH